MTTVAFVSCVKTKAAHPAQRVIEPYDVDTQYDEPR